MVRYVLTKVLRDVKALQTRKNCANGFENLLLPGLASHSKNFRGKLRTLLLLLLHN